MASDYTRRGLLKRGMVAGMAASVPGIGMGTVGSQASPKLLTVPDALPDKLYSTERVGISRETHDRHLRLWQGYARKTNEIRTLLAESSTKDASPNQIYSEMRALKVNYAFAYGGYVNHMVFFDTLGAIGQRPGGDLMALIEASFGSYEAWASDWKATGIASRGWAFLGYDLMEDRLFNYAGDSQDTFPAWNHLLVLALDVYEHAYYLDFGTARGDYIDATLECIDWTAVEARLPR